MQIQYLIEGDVFRHPKHKQDLIVKKAHRNSSFTAIRTTNNICFTREELNEEVTLVSTSWGRSQIDNKEK